MRNYFTFIVSFLSMLLLMTSCQLIGDIFSAGVYTGIFVVVFVIVLIVVVIARLGKKG